MLTVDLRGDSAVLIIRLNLDLYIDGTPTLDEMKLLIGEWVQEHEFDCCGTVMRIEQGEEVDVEYIEIE